MGPADTGERATGSTVRLRALLRISAVFLAAIALVACSALVILTTVSRRNAKRVTTLNDGLRAADHVGIDLTAYGRASGLAYVTGDAKYESARARILEDLLAHLAEARALVKEPGQRELLATADRRIHDFLEIRRQAERRHESQRDVLIVSAPALQTAEGTQHELSRVGFNAVSAAEREAQTWNLIGNIIGITVGALVLIGFFTVGVGMRRWVFAPLLALSDGIDRFAAGDRAARVMPTGPMEFRHTAGSFNEMAARLEQQRADLLTFLAGVAHDLRNPLAAMRMSVQFLAPGRPLPPEAQTRKTLDLVGRQVTRLERMVSDFLDASRIEGGHLELQLERRDVRQLAQEAVDLYEASSVVHRLLLSLPDAPVAVRCDGERIAQVLNNLVSNAIKYSPHGGDVCVAVSEERSEAVISVSDRGIGISPGDVQNIFEPFRRTGASRETIPGVGLGLSVSRRIVATHGGHIDVQSTVGVGSTFRVHLPLSAGAPARDDVATTSLH